MKNLSFKPFNLLFNIIVLAVLFILIGFAPLQSVVLAVPIGLVLGVALGFFKSPVGSLFMAIQKEIWTKDIQNNLYKDNAFLNSFSKADKENISGRTVHIPQSGAGGDVVKNRSSLPATVKKRTDTPTSYQIHEYTSDPILIPNADTVELSYDKRQSVLQDEQANLSQNVAEDVLLSIVTASVGATTVLPSTSIFGTDGAAVPATAPTATGNVKAYTLKDLQKARAFFIRQKTWTEGKMYAIITAEAEAQLFPADSQVTATYMASVTEEERRNGVMYKVQGFKIFTRSTVLLLSAAGAFKPLTATAATTDVEGIVLYNGNQVEFALGDIKFFDNQDDATYYGDVYSFLVRAGARAKREKMEGVCVIKQVAAS
ncbi:hypothetical protein [Sphingobacterium cavernae]|uniref:hypothetical protein n=1 Tax=Sphingobacterium cavernae TaxID=2592657 RepID=UPI001CB81092|nr:hypothetical protein [Sphingobacterium cavernae]